MTHLFESLDTVVFAFDDQNQPPPQPVELPESAWRHLLGLYPIPENALRRTSLDLDGLAKLAQQQVEVHRQDQREDQLAMCLGNQALILQTRGKLDEALRIRREDELLVYQRLGDVRGQIICRANIALALQQRNQPDDRTEALVHLRWALAEAERLNLPEVPNLRQLLAQAES